MSGNNDHDGGNQLCGNNTNHDELLHSYLPDILEKKLVPGGANHMSNSSNRNTLMKCGHNAQDITQRVIEDSCSHRNISKWQLPGHVSVPS